MNESTKPDAVSGEEKFVPRPRRGRPRLDPVVRRKRILDVGTRLFTTYGFQETTVEAVGKAAGVTKRTIYELIGDKEELFRAVCEHCHANVGETPLDLPISSTSLKANLSELARLLIEHALMPETIAIERTVIAEQMRFPDLVRTVNDATRLALNRKLAIVFEGLAEQGLCETVDSFEAGDIFFDLVVGNIGFRRLLGFDEPPPSQAATDERIAIFIDGYLRRQRPTTHA